MKRSMTVGRVTTSAIPIGAPGDFNGSLLAKHAKIYHEARLILTKFAALILIIDLVERSSSSQRKP